MPTAEHQGAHSRLLTGGHRLTQRLLGGLQRLPFNADVAHVGQSLMALMAGHIPQRPA